MSHSPTATCPNCGHAIPALTPPARHCPQCGQATHLHAPTLVEFVHEFVSHYVALEGALWRSLWALLARPGHLTREYLAGRRLHYVLPLRLFLSLSFLFFLLVKVLGLGPEVEVQGPVPAGAPLGPRLVGLAPYAVLALLPVYAGLVALLYRGRRRPYGEHFVFGLHLHAFFFAALLIVALVGDRAEGPVMAATALYGVLALQRTYGGRWPLTLLRAVVLTVAYTALLVATVVGGVTAMSGGAA